MSDDAPGGMNPALKIILGVAAGLLFAALVLVRLIERTTDREIGAYLEAAAPDFDALVLSALEARERVGSTRARRGRATGAGAPVTLRPAPTRCGADGSEYGQPRTRLSRTTRLPRVMSNQAPQAS